MIKVKYTGSFEYGRLNIGRVEVRKVVGDKATLTFCRKCSGYRKTVKTSDLYDTYDACRIAIKPRVEAEIARLEAAASALRDALAKAAEGEPEDVAVPLRSEDE